VDLSIEARRIEMKPRILVTRLRYLGDVIISQPVITAVKQRYPDAGIYYLAQPGYADIINRDPALSGIIEYQPGVAGFFRTVSELRRLRFIAAVDLFYNPARAYLLYWCGIPFRIGGNRKWRRRFYTDRVKVPAEITSAVQHHLYFLRTIDIDMPDLLPKVYLSEDEKEKGRGIIDRIREKSGSKKIVAFHAGGKWPAKRWPSGRYASLAGLIGDEIDSHVAIITGPGEELISESVYQAAKGNTSILSKRPIREVAAIIDACDAVVANDGGIVHLAVALGKPTVALFGPTDPDIWFPYSGKGPFAVVSEGVQCSPCDLHRCEDMRCMDNIKQEKVIASLLSVTGW